MPGSYYSDVERTVYLTYYILMEDVAKYDELFQQERKFLSFEYASAHVRTAAGCKRSLASSRDDRCLPAAHPTPEEPRPLSMSSIPQR